MFKDELAYACVQKHEWQEWFLLQPHGTHSNIRVAHMYTTAVIKADSSISLAAAKLFITAALNMSLLMFSKIWE